MDQPKSEAAPAVVVPPADNPQAIAAPAQQPVAQQPVAQQPVAQQPAAQQPAAMPLLDPGALARLDLQQKEVERIAYTRGFVRNATGEFLRVRRADEARDGRLTSVESFVAAYSKAADDDVNTGRLTPADAERIKAELPAAFAKAKKVHDEELKAQLVNALKALRELDARLEQGAITMEQRDNAAAEIEGTLSPTVKRSLQAARRSQRETYQKSPEGKRAAQIYISRLIDQGVFTTGNSREWAALLEAEGLPSLDAHLRYIKKALAADEALRDNEGLFDDIAKEFNLDKAPPGFGSYLIATLDNRDVAELGKNIDREKVKRLMVHYLMLRVQHSPWYAHRTHDDLVSVASRDDLYFSESDLYHHYVGVMKSYAADGRPLYRDRNGKWLPMEYSGREHRLPSAWKYEYARRVGLTPVKTKDGEIRYYINPTAEGHSPIQ